MKDIIAFLVVLTLIGYVAVGSNATANEEARESNVTISAYVAIGLSNNWTGIEFGNLNPNTADNNASHNNDGTGSGTSYWVTVSTDSNINADLCIKDNLDLTSSGGDTIGNGNYTWDDDSAATGPSVAGGSAITTSYAKTGVTNIAPGSQDYFRFWLTIPPGQPAGTYNNTVSIKGVTTSSAC